MENSKLLIAWWLTNTSKQCASVLYFSSTVTLCTTCEGPTHSFQLSTWSKSNVNGVMASLNMWIVKEKREKVKEGSIDRFYLSVDDRRVDKRDSYHAVGRSGEWTISWDLRIPRWLSSVPDIFSTQLAILFSCSSIDYSRRYRSLIHVSIGIQHLSAREIYSKHRSISSSPSVQSFRVRRAWLHFILG